MLPSPFSIMKILYVTSGSISVRFKLNGASQVMKTEQFPTMFAERELTASRVPTKLILI